MSKALPTRSSYSALTTYEGCPLSYYLSYTLEGYESVAGPAADRGTRLHRAMERFIKDEIPKEQMPLEFNEILDDIIHAKSRGGLAEEVWLVDHEWNYQEGKPNEQTRFKAIVDLHYLEEDDILYVIDFKSGRRIPESHADQLQLYATMGFSRYPEVAEVRAMALYLDGFGATQTYPKAMAPFLRAYWDGRFTKLMLEEEWEANPGPNSCRWCDFAKLGECDSPWGRK